MIYLRARTYDSALGRFTTRDPASQFASRSPAVSRYVYAGNDPLNFADPLGTWPLPSFVSHLVHRVAHSIDVARHDVAHGFDVTRHDTAHGLDVARHSVAHGLDVGRHDTAHDFDVTRHEFARGLDVTRHSIAHGFDTSAGFDVARHSVAHYGDVTGRWIAARRTGIVQGLLIAGAVLLTAVNVLQLGLDPVTDAAEGADVAALAGNTAVEAGDTLAEGGESAAEADETEASTEKGRAGCRRSGLAPRPGPTARSCPACSTTTSPR
jgi:hypothetical protein